MHLENMHRTIKHIFLKGKSVKRLDKAIHAIMQMIKQKLFDRLFVIEIGKLTTKLKQLRTRHKKSLEMSVDLVISNDESSWEIASSSSSGKTYTLRLIESKCHCRIVCNQCTSCIHKFSCTCIDSCIKWNMCKHIHLLCRKLKLERPEIKEECDNECNLLQNPLIIEDDKDSVEKHVILKEVGSKSNNQKSIELLKLQLKQQFDQICKKISTSKDERVANQTLKNLDAKLNSTKKHSIGQLKIRRNYSANKNLELQRRFQSTKNKKKNTKSIKRPSEEEAQKIALNTLLQTPPTSN